MSQAVLINDLYNFADNGIPVASFKSEKMSLSSSSGVCVRIDEGDTHTLALIDMNDIQNPLRFPMKAEAAIQHRKKPTIVVLRTPTLLQALDVSTKTPLGKYVFQTPIAVEFWSWISDDTLAIVSADSVYFWTYTTEQFTTAFARDPQHVASLSNTKITGVDVSADRDWAAVSAIGLDASNSVQGMIQLHCFSKNVSKVIPGHACALGQWKEDDNKPQITILAFAVKATGANEIVLNIMEAGPQKGPDGMPLSGFTKKACQIPLNPGIAGSEYPLYLRVSKRFGLTFLITKFGTLYVHDIATGVLVHQGTICNKTLFTIGEVFEGCVYEDRQVDYLAISTEGRMYSIAIDRENIVSYITDRLNKQETAYKLAVRANLRGGSSLFDSRFETLFSTKQWKEAALMVKKSPADTLRNRQTLERFVSVSNPATLAPGEKPPVLIYLSTLLESDGKLANEWESVKLAEILLAHQKQAAIETYLREKKFFDCEALGDLLAANKMDKPAFAVYAAAKAHEKVLVWLITHGQLSAIPQYAERNPDFHPDYATVISKGLAMGQGLSAEGVEALRQFADGIVAKNDATDSVDENLAIVNVFVTNGYVREATSLLLEVCKRGKFGEATGIYQTRIIQVNLEANPQIADAMLAKGKLQHIDRHSIAVNCETAGLYQRAFEFCDDDDECTRIAATYGVQNGKPIFDTPEWYANYVKGARRFTAQTQEAVDALFVLQQNLLDVVVGEDRIYAHHVALAFSRSPIVATSPDIVVSAVQVFEAYNLQGSEALFIFLAAIFPSSTDPGIHNLYLRTAIQLPSHETDILRVAQESQYIDGGVAFTTLTETEAANPAAVVTALLTACMRFKLTGRLVSFLCEAIVKKTPGAQYFSGNATSIFEQYLTNYAPAECHVALAALFQMGVMSSNDIGLLDSIFTFEFLSRVVSSQAVRDKCDVTAVVDACLLNSKTTKIARPLLEARLLNGASDHLTHTAFGKIMIETRSPDAERFLTTDPYVTHEDIARFCLSTDKRRRDNFVQALAFKGLVSGTFGAEIKGKESTTIVNQKNAHLLVEIAYGGSLYRDLALILITKKCKPLWDIAFLDCMQEGTMEFTEYVLSSKSMDNHRDLLMQAIALNPPCALEKLDEEQVFVMVQSFVAIQGDDAKIARYLLEVLEKVVLTPGSTFLRNTALQNLLIINAIKAQEYGKVSAYIKAKECFYDADVVAKACVDAANITQFEQLYEDAFEVYRRFNRLADGAKILLTYMSLEKAVAFATQVNLPEVWGIVGSAQIDYAQRAITEAQDCQTAVQRIKDSVSAFMKSKTASDYRRLISIVFLVARDYAEHIPQLIIEAFQALTDYLRMARGIMFLAQNQAAHCEIDTALMYCLARLGKYDELDAFLHMVSAMGAGVIPNRGSIKDVGDRCYSEMRYEPARLLFSAVNDWFMLALTLLKLGDYRNAIDAARKADSPKCWREVNAACLVAGEVALAKTAGLYLVVLQDELPGVTRFYEERGCINELIDLLESGTEHPQAKAYTSKELNIFTMLATIYCQYMWFIRDHSSQKLYRFLKAHTDKISVPTLIKKTREARLWRELVFLYTYSNDFDLAAQEMITHPPVSFDHKQLLQIVGKVSKPELLVDIAEFYFSYAPAELNEFLRVSYLGYFHDGSTAEAVRDFISVDPAAVVRIARRLGVLPLITEYLELLVKENNADLHNALVEVYVTSYNAEALRKLLAATLNFDTGKLLAILMGEGQTDEMKKVAVVLYGKLKRYDDGVRYAIQNEFYEEAAECAAASQDVDQCEGLLRLVCSDDFPNKAIRREVFSICLLRCGNIVRGDIVMELAWIHDLMDNMMPFMIMTLRKNADTVEKLSQDLAETRNELEFVRQKAGVRGHASVGDAPRSARTGEPQPQAPMATGQSNDGNDGFSNFRDGSSLPPAAAPTNWQGGAEDFF